MNYDFLGGGGAWDTKKCQRYVRPKEHGSSLCLGAER